MEDLISPLKEAVMRALQDTKTKDELEAVRIRFLGKYGELTNVLKSVSKFGVDERKIIGSEGNKLKIYITDRILALKSELESKNLKSTFDITLPGIIAFIGGEYCSIICC